jgi:hypothetical protein
MAPQRPEGQGVGAGASLASRSGFLGEVVLDGRATVDSSVPPPPSRSGTKLRPWYLVAAMVLTWFVGVVRLSDGYTTADFLRRGTMPDSSIAALHAATMADVMEFAELQAQAAKLAHARLVLPLSVAQVLLAGLLVVASGLALGGRRGARGLALQAILANAVLVIAVFALTPMIRAAYLDGILRAITTVTLTPPEHEALANPRYILWAWRIKLVVFDLGLLGLGALALTRARTRTYFAAVARATESPEEP